MAHGDFTHIEIPADDPGRATRFYGELFGWAFSEMPDFPGYHLFLTPAGQEAVGGAVGERGRSAPTSMRTYVSVDHIDNVLPKVADLGGRIVEEKREVPGQGWYAVLQDSEGNEIAIWESLPAG